MRLYSDTPTKESFENDALDWWEITPVDDEGEPLVDLTITQSTPIAVAHTGLFKRLKGLFDK